MSIDLHCHTVMSDGTTSIEELISLAVLNGLKAISVTDHDTFAGCVRAEVISKKLDLNVISGVEISSTDYSRGNDAHILCYFPAAPNRLEGLLKRNLEVRRQAMMICIQKVLHMYKMPVEMILKRSQNSVGIYNQHIMQALMDAGYTDKIYGDVYKKLFAKRIGFANTKKEFADTLEVIDEIHAAGGLAVLAHPTEYGNMDLAVELCEKNLIDGIEYNSQSNSEEDKKTILELSKKYNKFYTGGSNFHGHYTVPNRTVGSYTTESSQFIAMKKLKTKSG